MAAATSSHTNAKSAGKRSPLTPHDWKVIGSFGILVAALAMYDAKLALYMVGVASAVIVVRNADKVGGVLS